MDKKEFKSLLNGLVLPSKGVLSSMYWRWEKTGGFAGEKTLRTLRERVVGLNWTVQQDLQSVHPDGSSVNNGTIYVSPCGKLTLEMNHYYGETAHYNRYSAVIRWNS